MPTSENMSRYSGPRPRLDFVHGGPDSTKLVIVAHGGQENSYAPPHSRRPALLRMWPFVRASHDADGAAAVALMRYRYRGWNGEHSHPLEDLRSALRDLPGDVRRILLVGHSMGGRTVIHCAGDPRVRGVLALAPWLPATDPVPTFGSGSPDTPLLVTAHGTRDDVTDPAATSAYVRRIRESGRAVAEFRARGEGHALLERHGDWDELVRRFVTAGLGDATDAACGDTALGPSLTDDPGHIPDELPHWSHRRGAKRAMLAIARARVDVATRSRANTSGARSIVWE